MSDSESDLCHHSHRRRRAPLIAFYGPIGGGNTYPANRPATTYQSYSSDPPYDHLPDYPRVRLAERRSTSPPPPPHPSRRYSWMTETMERLSAEIKTCGFEPRKLTKTEEKISTADGKRCKEDHRVKIEGMNAKMTKLEDAMKSVQDTLQSCLLRLRRGEDVVAITREWRELQEPVWRQRRFLEY
ncbi:uncharacterized protein RCC_10061 [Ramularia collo-cygni]|uniref:Uncharacterized protein n=1 Tax=Ramularia collo-cygni TaxID=112498 RepID=A0A2D3VQE5_9PEZI|nr:uncharacterized protein RCC_10061 [Ramularia collo-cygni]CZT24338.1 uncharacterized protein RCC_10061 [Ramularia collo-cygni]